MIDINLLGFAESFDIKQGTVGVVGHGYVGKAVDHFFNRHCKTVVYDKAQPEFQTLADVVRQSEVIFVCVPTPMMKKDGSCWTGIVESVLQDIKDEAAKQVRNLDSFVVVVKSTVWPGFTEEMQLKHTGMRLCFSPEFLTEKASITDFQHTNRIIVGGGEADALVVCKFFQGVQPERHARDELLLLQCEPTVAEMVKLFTNGILTIKVAFSNEIYQMCQKLGVEYEDVRQIACLDRRIGSSHTLVPGPDGQFGFGGHCFPKDLNNLRKVCTEIGIPERLFTAAIERNKELREDKDWEKMEGRAVIDV